MNPPDAPDLSLVFREAEADALEVVLAGALHEGTVAEFREALEQHQTEGFARLILDCRDLKFLSSAGLSALILIYQRRKRAGQELILSQVPSEIRKLLKLTRLDDHFVIINSPNLPEE